MNDSRQQPACVRRLLFRPCCGCHVGNVGGAVSGSCFRPQISSGFALGHCRWYLLPRASSSRTPDSYLLGLLRLLFSLALVRELYSSCSAVSAYPQIFLHPRSRPPPHHPSRCSSQRLPSAATTHVFSRAIPRRGSRPASLTWHCRPGSESNAQW